MRIHPLKLEEWTHDVCLIVDYEPEATVWDLFKFEYMKLHGSLPPDIEIDYPDENELRMLSISGFSPTTIATRLSIPRWLVLEALEYFKIPYCNTTIDATGITKTFRSGLTDKHTLAKRFGTTVYYINKALKINGEVG